MFVQLRCFCDNKNLFCVQEFGDHPNIVKLLNVTRAQNDKDIYLIFEYMGEFSSCAFYSAQQRVKSCCDCSQIPLGTEKVCVCVCLTAETAAVCPPLSSMTASARTSTFAPLAFYSSHADLSKTLVWMIVEDVFLQQPRDKITISNFLYESQSIVL